jgi:choline dehydrogenase-like flavoprotein
VVGSVVDHAGRARGRIEVTAHVVVLAAGAVASPDLLLRSRLGGPEVGRHLHLHPSVMVAGYWPEPIHAYRGIPQSYYIDEFIDLERDPHTGYVLMPIAGFPVLAAVNVPGFGREHYRLMRDFAKLGGLLVLLHDRSEGTVRSGRSLGKPEIRYSLDAADRAQLARGLHHCAEVLFAAGAQRVVLPFFSDPIVLERGTQLAALAQREVREGTLPIASTHPQSTCRMGGDPATSVVNAWGELHGVRGVFVADMSVFPTSLGAPPQITTAALADRTARHILARGSELAA